MGRKGVVHIVNFVRGCEPRPGRSIDLLEAVRGEMKWLLELDLPATWLLQHDALIDPAFADLFRGLPGHQELGLWFEFPQALVEKAGLSWRGRYPWDWHSHVGFSVGYAPEDRRRIADIAIADFVERFRRLPTAGGSWMLDAVLLAHLADIHGFAAFCNCKDQWGTDGYSLWGGYWNGAYFPSRRNAFMPAQTPDEQIRVPVYRMLGSDPIYQYDCAAVGEELQAVHTLEPISPPCGGSPAWNRWFFPTIFETPSLAGGGYTQTGQENSFGWPRIGPGYADQLALLREWVDAGRLSVETMTESGRSFSARHELTPALAVAALEDWRGKGRQSVWFNNRFQRLNLYRDADGRARVRDWHLFDGRYAERYLDRVCEGPKALYDTLPVMEGMLWGGGPWAAREGEEGIGLGDRRGAGVFFTRPDGTPLVTAPWDVRESGPGELWIDMPLEGGGTLTVRCHERGVTVSSAMPYRLEWRWSGTSARQPSISRVDEDRVAFTHECYAYGLRLASGHAEMGGRFPALLPDTAGRLDVASWTGA